MFTRHSISFLDYIARHGRFKEPAARRLFAQLLGALTYCHARGIVHRDLKVALVVLFCSSGILCSSFSLALLSPLRANY